MITVVHTGELPETVKDSLVSQDIKVLFQFFEKDKVDLSKIVTPYFLFGMPNVTYHKNSLAKLMARVNIDKISYAYSDFLVFNSKDYSLKHQMEHPYDLRIIINGYTPEPMGLFKTSIVQEVLKTNKLEDMMRGLYNVSLMMHLPEALMTIRI